IVVGGSCILSGVGGQGVNPRLARRPHRSGSADTATLAAGEWALAEVCPDDAPSQALNPRMRTTSNPSRLRNNLILFPLSDSLAGRTRSQQRPCRRARSCPPYGEA